MYYLSKLRSTSISCFIVLCLFFWQENIFAKSDIFKNGQNCRVIASKKVMHKDGTPQDRVHTPHACTTNDCRAILDRNYGACRSDDCRYIVISLTQGPLHAGDYLEEDTTVRTGKKKSVSTMAQALVKKDEGLCQNNEFCVAMLNGNPDMCSSSKACSVM